MMLMVPNKTFTTKITRLLSICKPMKQNAISNIYKRIATIQENTTESHETLLVPGQTICEDNIITGISNDLSVTRKLLLFICTK